MPNDEKIPTFTFESIGAHHLCNIVLDMQCERKQNPRRPQIQLLTLVFVPNKEEVHLCIMDRSL